MKDSTAHPSCSNLEILSSMRKTAQFAIVVQGSNHHHHNSIGDLTSFNEQELNPEFIK
jgi:hypothetical protein